MHGLPPSYLRVRSSIQGRIRVCCHTILISLMISMELVAAGCPQYPPFTPVANLSGNPDVSLALAKAESLLQSVLQENPSIPGMVALAMHGGEVFWTAGLGLRNVTDPNSGELRFNRTTRLNRSYVHIVLYLLLLLRLCTAVDLRFGRTQLEALACAPGLLESSRACWGHSKRAKC